MGLFGNILGKFAGGALGGLIGGKKGRELGQELGSAGGSLLPFKKGGYVKKTTPALLHGGEFVLPKGVKPTKAQKAAVAKGKKGK